MVRGRRGLAAVVVALVGGVLAGCTGGGSDMPGLTASPSATPTATPTPTPTAEEVTDELGVVFDFSDPDLQLVFEDVPRELTGDAADVHNAIALLTRELWRSLSSNEVSPFVGELASSAVSDSIADNAATNAERGNRIGGVHRVTISDITVSGETATGRVCRDYREGTFEDSEGFHDPAEVGHGEPRLLEYSLINRGGGVWWVETITRVGTC